MNSNIFAGVGAILRHVAATVVMPRYSTIEAGEAEYKAPGEPVTIADREAEALIGAALLDLMPAARIVGEEACAANPALLDRLDEGSVWVIDPIDGTANFAAGRGPFAMMVALLNEGRTVGSWILDPLHDHLAVAELGSGAWLNGSRLVAAPAEPALHDLRGIISGAFRPPERDGAVERLRRDIAEALPTARCAGHEYPQVATGRRDFALYWRTLVWDHAPGALLLSESGGSVVYLDGSNYHPGAPRTGLLLAHHPHTADVVLGALARSD